jgi:hypothetical protein
MTTSSKEHMDPCSAAYSGGGVPCRFSTSLLTWGHGMGPKIEEEEEEEKKIERSLD